MESAGVLFVTAILGLGPLPPAPKAKVLANEPDTRHSRMIDAKPAHFAFLRQIKGQTHGQVLGKLGHPARVERTPDAAERWTYDRTDGKLFWVFLRNGRAIIGIPTDGFHIGGPELRW